MKKRLADTLMAFIIFMYYDTIKDWHFQIQAILEGTGLTEQYAYLGAMGSIALTIGLLWGLLRKITKRYG